MYPPSKYIVGNLINILKVFKQKNSFAAIRNAIARTLNLILTRNKKLCDEFKKHLPSLAQ
jgi:hypothetical protein